MESFELIKKFWEFNDKEKLGVSATSVYLFLVNMWDNNQNLDFSVSDNQIGSSLKLSRPTIRTAKETLRNLGLLSYKNREGFACIYKIITDYEFVSATQKTPKQKQEKIKFEETTNQPQKQVEPQSVPKIETPKTTTPKPLPKDIPTIDEFLNYAKTLEIYDPNAPNLDFKIKSKYESWIDNGWKNNYGNPIRNWKISLKNSFPYFLDNNRQTNKIVAPTIRRPKQTYNE